VAGENGKLKMENLKIKFVYMANANNWKYFLVTANLLAIVFFYSPVTIYGYWSDGFFLALIMFLTSLSWKYLQKNVLKRTILTVYTFNCMAIIFSSISIWHGVTPVHYIPKGQYFDKNTYAYFIERGNTGLTSGCLGQIQYHRQILWLPILEIRIKIDDCSSMDYDSIMNDF
jgi:hypothetical protein